METKAPSARRSQEIVDAVRPLAQRLAEENDLVLWDIAFLREAGRDTLRVACDRVGGIDADALATLSDRLSREIDHQDVVLGDQRYILELTSPGAERTLENPGQYGVCVGRTAEVELTDGRKVEGAIKVATDRAVEIETAEGAASILFDDIVRAQLVVKL